MLTTPELEDVIDHLGESANAVTVFAKRIAGFIEEALNRLEVEHHAINHGEYSVGECGFEQAMVICLTKAYGEQWGWKVKEGLAWESPNKGYEPLPVTAIEDTLLKKLAQAFAEKVRSFSNRVVFTNMYIPKAVELARGYNDLKIAFRVVRCWDPAVSQTVVRFDFLMKNLNG